MLKNLKKIMQTLVNIEFLCLILLFKTTISRRIDIQKH